MQLEHKLDEVLAVKEKLEKEKGRMVQSVASRKKKIGAEAVKQLQAAESKMENLQEEIKALRTELEKQALRAKEVEQQRANERVDLKV
jgi:chromosome segregation ATPase